jgi:hypothetical protein
LLYTIHYIIYIASYYDEMTTPIYIYVTLFHMRHVSMKQKFLQIDQSCLLIISTFNVSLVSTIHLRHLIGKLFSLAIINLDGEKQII